MKTRVHVVLLVALGLFAVGLTAGCSPEAPPAPAAGAPAAAEKEYNPHDVPITEEQKTALRAAAAQYPDALVKLREFRDAVEAETKAGIPENPYKAHQALDQADLLLQWLPEIARDSGVPKQHWEEINTTAGDLRTLMEKVHQNIDNQQDPDFASVAAEIDAGLTRLEAIAPAPPAAAPAGENQE